ncbi:MAG: OmpH family outer membrane protein [Candidatus Hydrogenedentes bacterium]|nr:OmpH family outer membrane protein [Candidatus Hydrogenedentota bacterium]MBI3119462.1 OmpH family outer membrane protein [Candidatus Hydrogenedentota bacterium]
MEVKLHRHFILLACAAFLFGAAIASAQDSKKKDAGKADKAQAPAVAAAAASAAPAAPASSGGYKIGVVDIQTLIADYPKRKQLYDNLEEEKKKLQAPIDAMSKRIEEAKKAYEDSKSNLSDEERQSTESKIQDDFDAYKLELSKSQRTLDDKEENVLKEVVGDIDKAIAQVAQSGNYHLILNSRGDSRGTVVFAVPGIDITPQVRAILKF